MAELDKKWNFQYGKLLDFKRKNGHCIVPSNNEHDRALGKWVKRQQAGAFHTKYQMRPDRKQLLDDIGFAFNVGKGKSLRPSTTQDKLWYLQYEKLVEFKRKNGHCVVPRLYEQDKALGHWVRTQHVSFHTNNTMRLDRKELLDEIGFVWKSRSQALDKRWNLQYEKLVDFKRKNGHCIVPQGNEQDKALGLWICTQQRSCINKRMPLDRKELLDEIGLVWKVGKGPQSPVRPPPTSQDQQWNVQYENLVEWKRNNGHCMVPRRRYEEQDKPLGQWVSSQQTKHANNKMQLYRKELLDKLGFVWRSEAGDADKKWLQQYKKLVKLKGKQGDDTVPFNYGPGTYLWQWAAKQRHFHKNNKIRHDRKELLEKIGFVWNVEDHAPCHHAMLGTYKKQAENCLAPAMMYKAALPLGIWDATQRNSLTNNKLRQDRKAVLDSEAFASSVSLPSEAIEETEPAQGHARNRFECPSLANRKRLRTCLAESGQIIADRTTNERDEAKGSCSSVMSEENDSKLSLVASNAAKMSSDTEEATPDASLPPGWTRTKLEPDW